MGIDHWWSATGTVLTTDPFTVEGMLAAANAALAQARVTWRRSDAALDRIRFVRETRQPD